MKKIFLIKQLFTLLAISLFLVSCAKKDDDEEVFDAGIFFNIVYQTQASRQIDTTSWTTVQGKQRFKFDPDVDDTGTDTGSGNFTVQYEAYKEPQLFNAGTCSGGYAGSYTVVITTGSGDSNSLDGPYNPLNPYNPGETTPDQTDGETADEDIVYNYLFTLTVDQRSFSTGCTAYQPQDSFQLRILRYPNGDLVITNASRSLEFYAIPELIQ
jgi:hypothetical protein